MTHGLRRVSAGVLLVIGVLLLFVTPALSEEKPSVIDDLLDIMRRSGQITEEQYREMRERVKAEGRQIQAGIDENLKPFLRTKDGEFRLELGGFVQADFHAAPSDARLLTGQELIDNFLIRRARINMTGQFSKWVSFKIEGDFTTSPSLTDGYIDLNFLPQIGLRAGQFKAPFSLEELTSDLFIDTIERSMVNELVPSRDVGVMLQGQLFNRVLAYAVGVFNGAGINASDNNNEKDVAGRIVLAPFRNTDSFFLKGLQIGINGTYGDEDARTSAQGRTSARTTNRFRFFAPQPTNGNRYRYGGDLAWLVGPVSFKAEYDRQIDERKKLGPGGTDLDDVIATGWYVTGTFLLTGENSVLNGPVIPRSPFSPLAGKLGPGAWELVARYQELRFRSDDRVDFFDGNINNGVPGGSSSAENGAQAVTGGINWYLNARVRAMVNYTQYWYDNSLGTPYSCRQASCAAGNLQRREDTSWEVLSRLQIWF
ncbi:MAG TPA: porin [Methylomirabilota bacterium]|jgi:phosphate-selective porin OprO/OprP